MSERTKIFILPDACHRFPGDFKIGKALIEILFSSGDGTGRERTQLEFVIAITVVVIVIVICAESFTVDGSGLGEFRQPLEFDIEEPLDTRAVNRPHSIGIEPHPCFGAGHEAHNPTLNGDRISQFDIAVGNVLKALVIAAQINSGKRSSAFAHCFFLPDAG